MRPRALFVSALLPTERTENQNSPCSLRLVPAPASVPAATTQKQHYEDNDQKSCGIHVGLL
jgi:hypothetical protein